MSSARESTAGIRVRREAASPRRVPEVALRGGAILLLLVLLWRQWPRDHVAERDTQVTPLALTYFGADTTGDSTVSTLLQAIVRDASRNRSDATPAWPSLGVIARSLPARASRAALGAAIAAGIPISWIDSTGARGLAVSAAPTPDPHERVVLALTGAQGPLVVRDEGGALDSLSAPAGGERLLLRRSGSWLEGGRHGSRARVAMPAPAVIKRLLVFARPGWEAKFTIAALEEAGWPVDATLPVSPRVSVTVGAPALLDTARYGAAIVLDSGIAPAATLQRYARNGGGVIVAGDGLGDRRLAALVPTRNIGERGALPGGLVSPNARSGLPARKVAAIADAIVVERDVGNAPATVGIRRGAGRVISSVYRESWRWRMEGGPGGIDAHRAWWIGLVRSVAYAPSRPADSLSPARRVDSLASALPRLSNLRDDPAPYASFVSRAGPPSSVHATTARSTERRRFPDIDRALLVIAITALLVEWASRRLRGAP